MPTMELLEELHSGESAGAAYIWELEAHFIFDISEGPLLGHGGRGPNVNTGGKEASKRGYPNPVARETAKVTLGEWELPPQTMPNGTFPINLTWLFIRPHLRELMWPLPSNSSCCSQWSGAARRETWVFLNNLDGVYHSSSYMLQCLSWSQFWINVL